MAAALRPLLGRIEIADMREPICARRRRDGGSSPDRWRAGCGRKSEASARPAGQNGPALPATISACRNLEALISVASPSPRLSISAAILSLQLGHAGMTLTKSQALRWREQATLPPAF